MVLLIRGRLTNHLTLHTVNATDLSNRSHWRDYMVPREIPTVGVSRVWRVFEVDAASAAVAAVSS